jgi:heptosyltransferase III
VEERFTAVWKGGAGVVVHPGSGGRAKRWPVARFCESSRKLIGEGVQVRWVVGRDDLEMDPGLERVMGEFDGLVLEGLNELADACLGARVWVGNDSGPCHVAGLLGTPTVVLFGVTDARVWAPVGGRVRVVESDVGMEGIGVERVIRDVRCMM